MSYGQAVRVRQAKAIQKNTLYEKNSTFYGLGFGP